MVGLEVPALVTFLVLGLLVFLSLVVTLSLVSVVAEPCLRIGVEEPRRSVGLIPDVLPFPLVARP